MAHPEARALRLRDYIQIVVAAALVALFLKAFVVGAYRIPSRSMENTLLRGDFLLVNKFVYGAKTPATIPFTRIEIPHVQMPAVSAPQRGDLVVFDLPPSVRAADEQRTYVKRCIALPGDTILIINKRVLVNGQAQALPQFAASSGRAIYPKGYSDPRMFPSGASFNEDNYGPLVVPKRGDTLALDASTFLHVKDVVEYEKHRIVLDDGNNVVVDGVACSAYVVQKNYFFMMGDNRDNSFDSRFWGFVPEENIIGKAMMIYFSVDASGIAFPANVRWGRIGTIVH